MEKKYMCIEKEKKKKRTPFRDAGMQFRKDKSKKKKKKQKSHYQISFHSFHFLENYIPAVKVIAGVVAFILVL